MQLETQNLIIVALNKMQLEQYILNDFSLEKDFCLLKRSRIVSERSKDVIITKMIPSYDKNSLNPLFHTCWIVIDKNNKTIVADLCFKGDPDSLGALEIGYATFPDFQNKGYMTEAVSGMIIWAFQQPNVNAIIAETDLRNLTSQKVLEKNNFLKIDVSFDNITWKIEKQK
jgi:[ribosomal protein S5]-alanine N-acetyltransferase